MSDAFAALRGAAAEGRLAHAYLLVGPPRTSGRVFAESVLKLLYCTAAEKPCGTCDGCHRVERRSHPDVTWLEPEKKSRVIGVEQVRDLNHRLAQTSFAGGWKAGVVCFADRMEDACANAFLKTLEEPPGRSLLLLVTEHPQALLPTLLSRCQRIQLSSRQDTVAAAWHAPLLEILRAPVGSSVAEKMATAARIKQVLGEVKRSIEQAEQGDAGDASDEEDGEVSTDIAAARVEAKYRKERSDLLETAILWHRDLLACCLGAPDAVLYHADDAALLRAKATSLTPGQAMANLRQLEAVVRRLDRNLYDLAALEACLLASAWP